MQSNAQNPSITLRQWRDSDLAPFAALNADPEVMRFFASRLTPAESKEVMERLREGIERTGWGLWAVEVEGEFAGFTGLSEPRYATHFTPCVEIGWRLRKEFWGRGIAYAAASQAEDYAFSVLRLEELVSFTTQTNVRSRRLMERLGFCHNAEDDFSHPLLPEGHPLIWHVLYRKINPKLCL